MIVNERAGRDPAWLEDAPVAAALLLAGQRAVAAYVSTVMTSAGLVGQLLRDMARAAARSRVSRVSCEAVWPSLFDLILPHAAALLSDRYWGPHALADLMPSIDKDQAGWVRVEALGARLEGWVEATRGIPECVDAFARVVAHATTAFQLSDGLRFVRRMMDSGFESVALRTRELLAWLRTLMDSIDWGQTPNTDLVAIVDGLVAGGDHRFLSLRTELDRRLGL